jgi:hypothetical protein
MIAAKAMGANQMHKKTTISPKDRAKVMGFLLQMTVYACFVFAYYFLVLHFLGDWLKQLFDHHRATYAAVALGLIVVQGTVLDLVTGWIVTLVHGKEK